MHTLYNTQTVNIGEAVEALKAGKKVGRGGWHGKGMWLAMSQPAYGAGHGTPFVYITVPSGDQHPWNASQVDLLADDWLIVE